MLGGGRGLVDQLRDHHGSVTDREAWLCPLYPGDMLAADALSIYAGAATKAPDAALIYADDDLASSGQARRAPHLKPDWNAELFEHHDFVSGASIVRATSQLLSELEHGNGLQALTRAALEHGGAPVHVPLVLHHRRDRPEPLVPPKPANLLPDPAPLVTAVIPTRNQAGLLRDCVEGLARAAYPHVETIIVDNGSDDRAALAYLEELEREGATVLRAPGPFNFSTLNNAAVRQAQGEMLCFLNNDVEMLDGDWLALLVRQAIRPDIGAVGARLLYPDRTVQHAGVFTGIGGGAGHAHRFQREDDAGYFERARLPQRVTAVTAACLVVAREKFEAVGGFDEKEFPVAFNDVDLCLKLNQRGWQSFYEPRATLIHHESKSRGSDSAKPNRARFAGELAALKRKWHTDRARDPFHHPHLSPFTEQFLISV
jgi:GT2 family glycosyltransferase